MKDLKGNERGIALLIALMALLLLSFLGLTLAATTSTELQIATNYRWGQQAFYNAEAGIEFGKWQLNTLPTFEAVLNKPGVRPPTSDHVLRGTRNFENNSAACDPQGIGYGMLLDIQTYPSPFEEVSVANFGQGQAKETLNGTFTLWVRRELVRNAANTAMVDDPGDRPNPPPVNRLILTSEGTAPFSTATATARQNRAVRVLEVYVLRPQCNMPEGGQVGGSSTGSGFAGDCGVDKRGSEQNKNQALGGP